MSSPMVNGRSVSRLKYLICCSWPFSNILKSSLLKLPTSPPFLSRTLNRMFTRFTSTLRVGESSCARSRAEIPKTEIKKTATERIGIILVDAASRILVPMRKAILHLKKSDPVMRAIIERVGAYKIQHREPSFETLVRSIVYQQLSGKVASVIFGRLIALLPEGKVTPEAILKLTPARMRKAGLSKQKTAYIRDLARKTNKGHVKFEALPDLADHEVIEHLTQVKGIGVWTAHMFLIFALRRLDIIASGDLGVRI